jgi:hypothetical protein
VESLFKGWMAPYTSFSIMARRVKVIRATVSMKIATINREIKD